MYRLYIDETGNADLGASDDPNHRYLSLTGIIILQDHVRNVVTPRLNTLKQDIFNPDPDEPIILHRKDIMQRNRPFHVLQYTALAQRFDAGLLALLRHCGYTVMTVVIDKLEHKNRYVVWRYEPYHYCMEILLERYVLWLRRRNAVGDVMGEVRGGKVDRKLERTFAYHYKHGNNWVRPQEMQRRLTSNKLKLKTKQKNITGLQIADVLAHPSALYVRSVNAGNVQPRAFGQEVVDILINQKYHRAPNGRIDGWGIKWLP